MRRGIFSVLFLVVSTWCGSLAFAGSFHTSSDYELISAADRESLAVPWTDVAAVVPDTVQVDTPMKLDAFGSVYFRTNDVRQPASTDVECYMHIDPGRSFV